jgi:hypothetical protein
MRMILSIILSAVFLQCSADNNPKGLAFKATLKGWYNLPTNNSGLESINASANYFLVEVKLINIIDRPVQFLSFTCTSVGNVILDSKKVKTVVNNCVNNSLTMIELQPKQEYSLTIILEGKNEKNDTSVTIGWIFIKPTGYSEISDSELLAKSRAKTENIIWSEPIKLFGGYGHPFEIK